MLSQGPVIGVLKIMSQLPELVQALLKPGSYPHISQEGKMGTVAVARRYFELAESYTLKGE